MPYPNLDNVDLPDEDEPSAYTWRQMEPSARALHQCRHFTRCRACTLAHVPYPPETAEMGTIVVRNPELPAALGGDPYDHDTWPARIDISDYVEASGSFVTRTVDTDLYRDLSPLVHVREEDICLICQRRVHPFPHDETEALARWLSLSQ